MLNRQNLFGPRDSERRDVRPAPAPESASPRPAAAAGAGPATSPPPAAAHPPSPAPASATLTEAARHAEPGSADKSGSKLIVGPNIKLKGVEITDCDTLIVEGHVEATMDSRLIEIASCGTFTGKAGLDFAEIHGAFDGELTVRKKLVVHPTGRVSGTIRYGKLVIEEGGTLAGDVQTLETVVKSSVWPTASAALAR